MLEGAGRDTAKDSAAPLSHTVLVIDDNPDDRGSFPARLTKGG